MPVPLRRLFNGGFNHLKSTSDLLYRVPHVVREPPLARRMSMVHSMPDVNKDVQDSHQSANTVPRPESHKPVIHAACHQMATSKNTREFVEANEQFLTTFERCDQVLPSRKILIVACMDCRIDLYSELGLKKGEAHVIRNAGAKAKEAIRSIVISQRLMGTREVAVFHHSDCGLLRFTTPQIRQIVKDADPQSPAVATVDEIDFLAFTDLDQAVRDDVRFLKEHPLVLPETIVTGWVHEVETGKIRQVV